MTWLHATIGDVCLQTTQSDPSRRDGGTFRYVDIAGIDREQKMISRAEVVPCTDAPSRARKEIKKGDVIVSTVRPNLNAIAQVPEELDGEIASTGFAVLRANPKLVDARWLFYRAQHPEFVDYLVTNAKGASYPAVSEGVVRRAALPLPSPSEQGRIVELLTNADRLRCLRRQADAKTARILPALFRKMFGDPAKNPMGLRKEPLGNLIKVKSGEFLPAKDMAVDGVCPVYGGNGVNGFHDHYMFEQRKVVLGRVGVYCGAVHYSEPRAWITDNALYISEKFEPLDDLYLVAALEQANLNQYAGRAGQPLISGSRIYPIEILVPPEVEQRGFASFAAELLELVKQNEITGKRLDKIWGLLMQRAFSGQLTTKWREAHMNELLVEMEHQALLLKLHAPNSGSLPNE